MKNIIFENKKDVCIISCLAFIAFFSRIYFRSYGYDQYDVTLFKYGIDNLTPVHPPGYPVLLLLGKFLNYFTGSSVDSLIYISIISSVVFIISTYLISMILFDNRLISLLSAVIILVNPTVWLYGIIGMSDMFQAACAILIVLFCAAAFKYNNPKYLYLSIFIFGITLGIKLNHVLLLPLLIFVYMKIREKTSLLKSLASFVISLLVWIIPLQVLIAPHPPPFNLSTREILMRDLSAFNVYNYGPLNKIIDLFAHSAFVHYKLISLFFCMSFLIFLIYVLLYTKNNDVFFKEKMDLSFLSIRKVLKYHELEAFLMLWLLPYIFFNYLLLAPQLRYYILVYPSIILLTVFSFYKASIFDSQNFLYKKILKKSIFILLLLFILFSFYVSIDTVSAYHKNLDTRSQLILYYKDISLKNAQNGKETAVFINNLFRRDLYSFNVIYNSTLYTNMLETVDYRIFKVPFSEQDLKKSETELIHLMEERYTKNKDVYMVSDFVASTSPLDYKAFKLKKIATFYRQEWIIDDPQGYINVYRYSLIGEPLWNETWKQVGNEYDIPIKDLTFGKLEDGNMYTFLFFHAPDTGVRFVNYSIYVPDEKSATLDLIYGFVYGAEKTNGVNFSVVINGKNVLSHTKLYNNELSIFSYNLSEFEKSNVSISLGVDANGSDAFDWSVWIPTIAVR